MVNIRIKSPRLKFVNFKITWYTLQEKSENNHIRHPGMIEFDIFWWKMKFPLYMKQIKFKTVFSFNVLINTIVTNFYFTQVWHSGPRHSSSEPIRSGHQNFSGQLEHYNSDGHTPHFLIASSVRSFNWKGFSTVAHVRHNYTCLIFTLQCLSTVKLWQPLKFLVHLKKNI